MSYGRLSTLKCLLEASAKNEPTGTTFARCYEQLRGLFGELLQSDVRSSNILMLLQRRMLVKRVTVKQPN
jgi:hypothetical protein